MIKREIVPSILGDFSRGKVIVLLGARQVGKTTLLSQLHADQDNILFLNCDNIDDRFFGRTLDHRIALSAVIL